MSENVSRIKRSTPPSRRNFACSLKASSMHMHSFPFVKALYDVDDLKVEANQIKELYPEIEKCIGCNTCTTVCPQDLQVMEYVTAALKGDYEKVAGHSLGCIMCTICGTQCPGELVPFYIALLCRRIYGAHMTTKDNFLPKRLDDIENNVFEKELNELMVMEEDSFEELYRKTQANKKMPDNKV